MYSSMHPGHKFRWQVRCNPNMWLCWPSTTRVMDGVQTPATTILSLPNELLVAIAAAGQEDRVQWTLSHVSRRFQTVMVGTPALWAVVQVDFRSEGSVKILQLYLERSQNRPISATLRHRSMLNADAEDLITARLAHIVQNINRISWLRIEVGNWGAEFLLTPFRDLAALNLEHLEVVNLIDYQWGPIELFAAAPRLRFLKLYDQHLPSPAPQWVVSLTHLELRHHGRDIALDATLGQCHLLVHLFLDLSFTKLERRVHMPFLKSLFLVVSGAEDDFDLLATVIIFDTPSLTECAIEGVHGDQIFELLSAKRLADHSFPALTALSFVNTHGACRCESTITFPAVASPSLFQFFPALSALSLVNICFAANLLKGVIVPPSEAWPILGTVALSPRAAALGDVRDVVLDAIHAHRNLGLHLPAFRLSPAFSDFEDWRGHGIDAKLFQPVDVIQFLHSR
ncbi:hypothetical protein C8R45DRAFT_167853 [Mycena sanguinolenta]|nr:hypothetical protein C8R45DRAFT_167853 [Mycena sanguinolenta]